MKKWIIFPLVSALLTACSGPVELVGEVHMINKLGKPCWYLRVDNKVNYELITDDNFLLQEGRVIAAKGLINRDRKTICQIGPVFEVESYVSKGE